MREAIIRLNDRELAAIGLDDIVTAVRDAGLEDLTELGPEGIHQVRVENPIPETDLEHCEEVEWWEKVDESPAGTTYLWQLRVQDCEEQCPLAEHSTAYEVSDVTNQGFDLAVIGSQEDISRSVDGMVKTGMRVHLERLSEYRGSVSTRDRLTDRQQKVVQTAYSLGYYDVPRVATTEDVAAEVGLDPSTVAEHLQRAERNLMDEVLVPAE